MAAIHELKKGAQLAGKALTKVGGVVALVDLGAALAPQILDAGMKAHTKRVQEKEALVMIPELYSSNFRLKLEDAKRCLEEVGLKAVPVVAQPRIAYKDCSDLEVVATNHKQKQKVKPGKHIILIYVTSEVIEASRKLFDESEKQKAEDKQRKAERDARHKQKLDETVAHVQRGFNDFAATAQTGIEKFSKASPRKRLKDHSDTVDTVIKND